MKIEDVLNAYPSRLGEAEVTDSDKLRDLREWADTAASTLRDAANEIAAAMSTLDELGVPRNAGPGNPVSIGQPFGLESRLVQLRTKLAETEVDRDNLKDEATRAYQQRNEAAAERDQLRKMHDGVSADLDRERREHQEAMAEAATRELKLTEERDELSERYNRVADDLQAALEQAEHDAHKLTDADELTIENLRLERLVKRLTSKVKRREDDIKRYRAELAKKPKAAAKRSRRKS